MSYFETSLCLWGFNSLLPIIKWVSREESKWPVDMQLMRLAGSLSVTYFVIYFGEVYAHFQQLFITEHPCHVLIISNVVQGQFN